MILLSRAKMGGFLECFRGRAFVIESLQDATDRHRFFVVENGAPSVLGGFHKSKNFWNRNQGQPQI
jgi:hypothetical protein